MYRNSISTLLFCVLPVNVLASGSDKVSLEDLSLEGLSKVKVYSASKKNEDPDTSPSSVYVITADDISQMGVTHIADALRTVPGLHVAKLSSSKWMVSSRGFGEQFSNKLLVLVDGRPVYSPMYSGVYWDQQDFVLSDIQQIEVIRGPGATLWGANAVNGVINIITKHAKDTQNGYVSATYGNHYEGIAEGRFGSQLSEGEYLSSHFKLRNSDDAETLAGLSNNDGWRSGSLGFRYDNQINYNNSLNIYGAAYRGVEDITYNLPALFAPFIDRRDVDETFQGVYLGGKLQYGVSDDSDISVESYLNYDQRDFYVAVFNVLTFSANIQHDWKPNDTHNITWGGGYTAVDDKIDDSIYLTYTPNSRLKQFFNIFGQDTIRLPIDDVLLTLGTKLEHNGYSGFEYQPSVKLSWQIDKNDLLWGSISRALRTPSRGTQDLSLQGLGTPGGYVSRIGNQGFEAEKLIAYEIGYKKNITSSLYADITGFFNSYKDLRTFERGASFGNIFLPLHIDNNGSAENLGAELSVKYSPTGELDFWLSYSYIHLDLTLDNNAVDNVFLNDTKKTPQQQVSVRSSYAVTDSLTLNNSLYYIDSLPVISTKDYLKWDSNITYRAAENITISIAAENILQDEHKEYSAPLYADVSAIPRSVFARLEITF